jgi:hypothetical protein
VDGTAWDWKLKTPDVLSCNNCNQRWAKWAASNTTVGNFIRLFTHRPFSNTESFEIALGDRIELASSWSRCYSQLVTIQLHHNL